MVAAMLILIKTRTGSWSCSGTGCDVARAVIATSVPVLESAQIRPLMVLKTDSGCSKISFCMKASKEPEWRENDSEV